LAFLKIVSRIRKATFKLKTRRSCTQCTGQVISNEVVTSSVNNKIVLSVNDAASRPLRANGGAGDDTIYGWRRDGWLLEALSTFPSLP